ncbi:helix-turn-helix transcriptional regulator [Faecalibacterium sp. I2-3-92]|nr:helix-turn-helix transcriptional regulator [Faecalibacterium sp. I2-3-92]UQK47315.1 helix-turn-helix transcriptional regulator [Faecalibacterium sp. I2-3-92]
MMKDNNISRSDLAEAAGVTPEYVSMVLNKRRNPAGAENTFRAAIQKLLTEKE